MARARFARAQPRAAGRRPLPRPPQSRSASASSPSRCSRSPQAGRGCSTLRRIALCSSPRRSSERASSSSGAASCRSQASARGRAGSRRLLALLLVYLCIDLIAVSAPISSPDALLYHAADPRLFAQSHRIFEIPWNSSSYEPYSVEMLVLDGFLLWNPVQGAFVPLLLAVAALAAVGGFAYRVAGRSAALLAAPSSSPNPSWSGRRRRCSSNRDSR